MAFERLMGLYVSDPHGYRLYREAMRPIMEEYGGRFRYDFEVSKVLESEHTQPINRVFILSFPTQRDMENFFADARYLKVKEAYFSASVTEVSVLAMYAPQCIED